MSAATDSLAERLRNGETRALARAISWIEDDDPRGWDVVRAVYPDTGRATTLGMTGTPGVGKSTLLSAMVARLRTVGVLSVDPSSPFGGGAVLGDRIRMSEHFLDRGVFIRSMATRGALGGLAEGAMQAMFLMDAAGYDDIVLETVGVGQSEVDIIGHADAVVLVLMPGSGDSIQALKAGVMEIPDVIVVNKADHPMADTMVRHVRSALSAKPSQTRAVQIVKTEAVSGKGIDPLLAALDRHRAEMAAVGRLAERRRRNLSNEVLALAAARLRSRLAALMHEDAAAKALLDAVIDRKLDPASAAQEILAGDLLAKLNRGRG